MMPIETITGEPAWLEQRVGIKFQGEGWYGTILVRKYGEIYQAFVFENDPRPSWIESLEFLEREYHVHVDSDEGRTSRV